jgi:hypothetical protein
MSVVLLKIPTFAALKGKILNVNFNNVLGDTEFCEDFTALLAMDFSIRRAVCAQTGQCSLPVHVGLWVLELLLCNCEAEISSFYLN